MVGKKGDIFNFSIKFIDYEHDYIHDHRGVVKTLQTLKKVLKWWGKKDISSNLVWNPLTMSMAMTRGVVKTLQMAFIQRNCTSFVSNIVILKKFSDVLMFCIVQIVMDT